MSRNKQYYAILKNGGLVKVSLITERGFWIFKRYLVAYTTSHLASPASHSMLGYELPASPAYTSRDTEWVKIVGEIRATPTILKNGRVAVEGTE